MYAYKSMTTAETTCVSQVAATRREKQKYRKSKSTQFLMHINAVLIVYRTEER